ncbi:MAG: hypothetical protein U1F68_06315 [Gammaproteobacteria bacterium]
MNLDLAALHLVALVVLGLQLVFVLFAARRKSSWAVTLPSQKIGGVCLLRILVFEMAGAAFLGNQ